MGQSATYGRLRDRWYVRVDAGFGPTWTYYRTKPKAKANGQYWAIRMGVKLTRKDLQS